MKKKKTFIIAGVLATVIIGGSAMAVSSTEKNEESRKEAAHEKAVKSLKLSVKKGAGTIAYAASGSVDPIDLIEAEDENGSLESGKNSSNTLKVTCSPETINPNQTGTYQVVYTVSTKDSDQKTISRKFTESFSVTDRQAPEIAVTEEKKTVENGTVFNPDSVVVSVKDPVDGDLAKAENTPEKQKPSQKDGPVYDAGWYTVASNVDTGKEGDYKVSIHACDRNGNGADKIVAVHVNAAPQPTATPAPSAPAQNSAPAAPAAQNNAPAAPAPAADNGSTNAAAGDTGNATLNGLCDGILSSIINGSMDDHSRCYAIYQWTENNIHYRGGSSHADWVSGAITALSTRRGDCYAFYSAGRALLTRAGFATQQANIGDRHYWVKVMYNGQWLNWDATTGWGTERFLWTDDQLRSYSYYSPGYGGTLSYAGY